MKNFGAKWLALAAMSAAVAGMGLNGCGGSDNGTGTAGTGGSHKGGTTGSAGKGGTTGTAGTGGSTAGTGGAPKGGTTGTAGTGGATAGAGRRRLATGGADGGLPCPGVATFDTTVESFGSTRSPQLATSRSSRAVRQATLSFSATEGEPFRAR